MVGEVCLKEVVAIAVFLAGVDSVLGWFTQSWMPRRIPVQYVSVGLTAWFHKKLFEKPTLLTTEQLYDQQYDADEKIDRVKYMEKIDPVIFL